MLIYLYKLTIRGYKYGGSSQRLCTACARSGSTGNAGYQERDAPAQGAGHVHFAIPRAGFRRSTRRGFAFSLSRTSGTGAPVGVADAGRACCARGRGARRASRRPQTADAIADTTRQGASQVRAHGYARRPCRAPGNPLPFGPRRCLTCNGRAPAALRSSRNKASRDGEVRTCPFWKQRACVAASAP